MATTPNTTDKGPGFKLLSRYNMAALEHGGGNSDDLLVTKSQILEMDPNGLDTVKRADFLISEALRSKGEFIEGMGAICLSIAAKQA